MRKRTYIAAIVLMTAVIMMTQGTAMKAEAKYVNWSEYDRSTCICEVHDGKLWHKANCTSKRHLIGYEDNIIEEILAAAKPIVNAAPDAPHEAVKYFHDEICKRTTYTKDVDIYTSGAYGSLVKGRTKCTGYADALQVLCKLTDIPCEQIDGYSGNVPHRWNVVQLEDGEWYEIDVTADDIRGDNEFLFLTTEQIKEKGNKRDDSSVGLPIANGTLYAYNKKAVKVGNAKYKVTDTGKVEYAEVVKSAGGTITIPDTVTIGNTSYEVTSIAKNAFKGNKKIKKVVIGRNIETIGTGAFSKCPNLKTVDMSKCKVTSLSTNLFNGSKKLSKLTVNGDNVTSVDKNALKNISPKCKITIKGTSKNTGLIKKLKKQGGKKCKYNFK